MLKRALLCAAAFAAIANADVIYPGFASTAGLTLNGSTKTTTTADGVVLRLVPALTGQGGSAFSTSQINAADFSTFFQFRMTNPGGSSPQGADGLVFVVQTVSNSVGGGGGGEGYSGLGSSLGVEFDSFRNAWDPDNNHSAVLLDGDVSTHHSLTTLTPQMTNGDLWSVWIDYNGSVLEMRTNTTGVRPVSPTLSYTVNIPSIIGQSNAFVGFTAGTGAAFANHDIVDWRYNTTFSPIGGPTGVPEPGTWLLLSGGFAAIVAARRLRGR